MTKADNMFAVLLLLRARRRMTARQLAEELEIHIRTLYRCIDALCVSGVPIVRYAEAEQAERLDTQEAYLEVMHPPANAAYKSTLREIETAMDAQRSVQLRYEAGYEGSPSIRKFDPYGIVHWNGKWYTVGYCHLREEIRHFRVDRIREVRSVDSSFQRPATFSARDSLLDSLLPEAGVGTNDRLITITIQGSAQTLDDLSGHWLFSRTLVDRTVNQAVFQMDERSLYLHSLYYLLSFGGTIQILQPMELRDTMADIAESLHHHYRT